MINKTDKESVNPRWASHSHFRPRSPDQHLDSPPPAIQKGNTSETHTRLCPDVPAVNPEHQSCSLAEGTLRKLIEMNQNYLV